MNIFALSTKRAFASLICFAWLRFYLLFALSIWTLWKTNTLLLFFFDEGWQLSVIDTPDLEVVAGYFNFLRIDTCCLNVRLGGFELLKFVTF